MEFKVGDTFHNPFVHGRPLCHVRALVDDMVVFRYWLRTRREWCYVCYEADILGEFVARNLKEKV